MAGREDYAIVRARAISDPRLLRAAELYVETKLAREETALAAVLGHVACLGLWASRETSDGILPGDGVSMVRAATASTTSVARRIVTCLRAEDVDLITSEGCENNQLRLRGFVEAYRPLIEERLRKARWAQEKRERGQPNGERVDVHVDATSTSSGRPRSVDVDPRACSASRVAPDARVTGPDRTESPQPPAERGADASHSGNGNPERRRPREERRLAEEQRLEEARQADIERRRRESADAAANAASPDDQASHVADVLAQIRPGAPSVRRGDTAAVHEPSPEERARRAREGPLRQRLQVLALDGDETARELATRTDEGFSEAAEGYLAARGGEECPV